MSALAARAASVLTGRVTGQALRFGSILVLARVLGGPLFGVYVLAQGIYKLLELAATAGLQDSSIRAVAVAHSREPAQVRPLIAWSIGVPFVAGACCSLALILSAELLARWFGEPALVTPLRIFAVGLPFGATGSVLAFAATGLGKSRILVLIRDIGQPAAIFVGGAGMLIAGTNSLPAVAWLMTLANLAMFLAGIAMMSGILRQTSPQWRTTTPAPIRQLMIDSAPLWVAALSNYAIIWADALILGLYVPAEEVGRYRAAAQSALLLGAVLASVTTMVNPRIAQLLAEQREPELRATIKTAARWSLALTLPAFSIVIVAPDEILRMFGAGFEAAALPLLILAAAQIIRASLGATGYFLVMAGRPYRHVLGEILFALLGIGLNLAFIPMWGVVGAATASAIALVGLGAFRLMNIQLGWAINALTLSQLRLLAAAALAIVLGFVAHELTSSLASLARLSAVSIIIIIVYGAALMRFGLPSSDKQIVFDFLRGRRSNVTGGESSD